MNKTVRFFCVGVQKAGTSTLHDILQQHPDLCLPSYKETHFFRDDEVYGRGLSHYFDYFFDPDPGQLFGEVDPEYAYFDACAKRISEAFGKARIVFILRNPVDRAYSHYLMTRSRGLESLSFEDAVQRESERLTSHFNKIHFSYIARGSYSTQIGRYEELFGRDNVKVVLFEDFIRKTEQTVKDITTFVGLEPYDFNYEIQSNPASEAKSKLVRDFVYRPGKFKKGIGRLIPSKKIKDKIMATIASKNSRVASKEEIPIALKKELYTTYFANEIEKLEELLSVDLSHWKFKDT